MAKKKTKAKRRSFRQRNAAIIIASVLALGMVLSVVLIYTDFIFGDRTATPEDEMEQMRFHYEQLREYYEQQVENLKEALELTDNPAPAILRDLAGYYRELVKAQQILLMLGDETGDLEGYRDGLVKAYNTLIGMEPSNAALHKEFLDIYYDLVDDPEGALNVALILRDLLRDNMNTSDYLEMVYIISRYEKNDFVAEEASWLRGHLEEMLSGGKMENNDRYIYGLLLYHIIEDHDLAREQFMVIYEMEEEGTVLFNQAKNYLEYLDENNENN